MCADITQFLSVSEITSKPVRGLGLYVKDTGTIRGRGVFAGRKYAKGELVEVAPVIVFNACVLPRIIANILYHWEQQTKERNTRAIALGYGSLYNHDNPSNLSYTVDAAARVIRYTAVRQIAADEELTINYNSANGHCADADDLWFERHGMEQCPRLQGD